MDIPTTPRITLKACVDELRRRCETISDFQGGDTYYEEDLQLFKQFCQEKDLYFEEIPEELNIEPDEEGNEHQVWFHAPSNRYVKLTWTNFFGLHVLQRNNEEEKASPIDYLERWHLNNSHFGDDVRFLGVVKYDDDIRILIDQPAIMGMPAKESEVKTYFKDNGWKPFSINNNLAFYDSKLNLVISDTHPANLIKMGNGLLAPIDLRIEYLADSLVSTVERLCINYR